MVYGPERSGKARLATGFLWGLRGGLGPQRQGRLTGEGLGRCRGASGAHGEQRRERCPARPWEHGV